MVRVAVLVSGGGTNLQALIDGAPYEGGELSLVVSSHKDAYALERAALAGIPSQVLTKDGFASRAAYTDALIGLLEARGVGLVVLAGFLLILSPRFSEIFAGRVVNVHPSLVPSFCGKGFYGLRVHKAALEYGVKVTGATVHFVTSEVDGGPIIAQKAVGVLPGDTPESLQRRVMETCERPLLVAAVRDICAGRIALGPPAAR